MAHQDEYIIYGYSRTFKEIPKAIINIISEYAKNLDYFLIDNRMLMNKHNFLCTFGSGKNEYILPSKWELVEYKFTLHGYDCVPAAWIGIVVNHPVRRNQYYGYSGCMEHQRSIHKIDTPSDYVYNTHFNLFHWESGASISMIVRNQSQTIILKYKNYTSRINVEIWPRVWFHLFCVVAPKTGILLQHVSKN